MNLTQYNNLKHKLEQPLMLAALIGFIPFHIHYSFISIWLMIGGFLVCAVLLRASKSAESRHALELQKMEVGLPHEDMSLLRRKSLLTTAATSLTLSSFCSYVVLAVWKLIN
jgi:hypothetical protein